MTLSDIPIASASLAGDTGTDDQHGAAITLVTRVTIRFIWSP